MTLREYIENEILPRYSAFDKGHQRDHAESVIYESLVLAEAYGADKEMADIHIRVGTPVVFVHKTNHCQKDRSCNQI